MRYAMSYTEAQMVVLSARYYYAAFLQVQEISVSLVRLYNLFFFFI